MAWAWIDVPFKDVLPGEKFDSKKTKRCFGGVKIVHTMMAQGRLTTVNAVILTDHLGNRAEDAGVLIKIGEDEIVTVTRTIEESLQGNKRPLSWYEDNAADIKRNRNGSVTYVFDEPAMNNEWPRPTSQTTISKSDYEAAQKDPKFLV